MNSQLNLNKKISKLYPVVKTRAFILVSEKINEDDRNLILLTERFNKINVFVKSSRKTFSKLKAGTVPYKYGTFTLVKGNRYILRDYERILSKDINIWDSRVKTFWYVRILNFLNKNIPIEFEIHEKDIFSITEVIARLIINNDEKYAKFIALSGICYYLTRLGYADFPEIDNMLFIDLVRKSINDKHFRNKMFLIIKTSIDNMHS